ncbi:hypothetical protein GJAV_G00112480 [Gymnothorax javanicus]|nr:hypothetical protein GJAV_G00112480 [Gymnothorax javanicus]
MADGSNGLKMGGSQHLKNALNLGKVVGAKMTELLRRKDAGNLGIIGVMEVNRSAEAVWSCIESCSQDVVGNSHVTNDSFPRPDSPAPPCKTPSSCSDHHRGHDDFYISSGGHTSCIGVLLHCIIRQSSPHPKGRVH